VQLFVTNPCIVEFMSIKARTLGAVAVLKLYLENKCSALIFRVFSIKNKLTMPRQILTDELWLKLKAIMLETGIYDKPLLRLTIEGIFYRLRVGCPWRDLPEAFGHWNAILRAATDADF